MKPELWLVGKTSYPYIEEGMKVYMERIRKHLPFDVVYFPHAKGNMTTDKVKEFEAIAILKALKTDDKLVLFDDKGKNFTSEKFAEYLDQSLSLPGKRLIWLVGGAYGFSPEIYARAQAKVSLSSMTFSHQIIRLIILEQFYRAVSILRGEPYHHQ